MTNTRTTQVGVLLMRAASKAPLLLLVVIIGMCLGVAACGPSYNIDQLEKAEIPDTPVGLCAREYISTFASGTDDQIVSFYEKYYDPSGFEEHPVNVRVTEFKELRDLWGSIIPLHIALNTERQLIFLATTSREEKKLIYRFQLSNEHPSYVKALSISSVNAIKLPYAGRDFDLIGVANRAQRIDDSTRFATVKTIAELIDSRYIDPAIGKKIADALIQSHSDGLYDDIKYAGELARRLTEVAYAASNDLHLWIECTNAELSHSILSEHQDTMAVIRCNYGFQRVEVLPDNIGYIKFDKFRPNDGALDAATAALRFVAHCDALILDLRDNVGGSGMIDYLSSHLFSKPTLLSVRYGRDGVILGENWTLDEVPGPIFDSNIPLYILTSKTTASAAEGFAYALKHAGRAKIIGETTAGMAHPSEECIINKYFRILLPIERVLDPISKTDFEGVGVKPDIETTAEKALDTAIREAVKAMNWSRSIDQPAMPNRGGGIDDSRLGLL